MSLDTSKLSNVIKSPDGKITAACPACQAAGGDTKGIHLVIFPDGKYGCVANPKDKAHLSEIARKVGSGVQASAAIITVNTVTIPSKQVIMDLGKFSRFSKRPLQMKSEQLAADSPIDEPKIPPPPS